MRWSGATDRFPRWPMAAVLAFATAIRLWRLGDRSLWTDEGSTWTAASLPFADMIRRCLERDASPPLFYLLTSWALRFGDDEAHLRLVSVIASVGMVLLSYRIARLGAGRGAATFAALLCALWPFQVMYAQEARTYTLVACLGVLATYLFARAALFGSPRAWRGYALATALGLWTQSIALLVVVAQGAIALLTRDGRRRLLPWGIALLVACASYLPWWWLSRDLASHLDQSHWYIDEPNARGTFHVVRAVFLSPLSLVTAPVGAQAPGLDAVLPRPLAWALLLGAPILPLVASLAVALRPGDRGKLAMLAWLALAVPVVLVFAVSFRSPLFLPRYFVFTTPFVATLLALGVSEITARLPQRVWGLWLLLVAGYGAVRYHMDYSKEPWRAATRYMASQTAATDAVALVPFDVDPWRFYARRLAPAVEGHEVGHPDEPFAARYTPQQLAELEQRAHSDAEGHEEVWVFIRSPNSEVRREVVRRAERAAADGRQLVERLRWDSMSGPVRVSRWRRVPVPDSSGSSAAAMPATPHRIVRGRR